MRDRAATRLAWSLWVLTLGVMAPGFVLWAVGGFAPAPGSESVSGAGATFLVLTWMLSSLMFATIGVIVASRRPRNPIGWLCVSAGLMMASSMLAAEYSSSPMFSEPGLPAPGAAVVAWIGSLLAVWLAVVVPVVLLFPNGRLPGRRWAAVLWVEAATVLLALVAIGLRPGPLDSAPGLVNPFGVPAAAQAVEVVLRMTVFGLLVCTLLAATALLLRLRRARGDERQQFKWVAYAAGLWAVGLVASFAAPPAWAVFVEFVQFLTLAGLLAAVAIAVLKYRLYDVDLVINRTLVYGSLAILITLVYVALMVSAGALVGTRGEPNLGLSILATAVVAVAFQPLRERLQHLANQLVYGHRLSPYQVLSAFSRRMAGALSVDDVVPRMTEAATRGVGGVRGRVRVYVPGGPDQVITWPGDASAESFDRTVLVLHQGTPVGEIGVSKPSGEPFTSVDGALLADLAAQAGPALSNVRLTFELQARLAELATQADALRASRQRIVEAQDAERRRLERDIHDGAQQHLVAIAVNARLARQVLEAAPARTATLLDEISAQADAALETLRDLARGIYPAVLADRGLAPALRAQLARSTSDNGLEVDASVARARFDPRAEGAIYFCCLEALQNSAKHAPHAPVHVRICADEAWLMFEVVDQGPGFDTSAARPGTGLEGMADRLAALGGALSVESSPGQGTTVSGRVPVRDGRPDVQAGVVAAAQAVASRSDPNADLLR